MNHLCQSPTYRTLYRGACNMPNWTEAETCPQICFDSEDEDNMSDIQLVEQCDVTTEEYYCKADEQIRGVDCSRSDLAVPVFTLPGRESLSRHPRRELYLR